jgi:hypothetical protein
MTTSIGFDMDEPPLNPTNASSKNILTIVFLRRTSQEEGNEGIVGH